MVDLLKKRALWYHLSWEELLAECAEYKVNTTDLPSGMNANELWCNFSQELFAQLLERRSLQIWKARGFAVGRCRTYLDAAQLVALGEHQRQTRPRRVIREVDSSSVAR